MDEAKNLQPVLVIFVAITTLATFAVNVYKSKRDPDEKNKEDLDIHKEGCKYRHENLDDRIDEINKSISNIKDNHLKHIESNIEDLKEGQTKILTIMEYLHNVDLKTKFKT